MKSAGQLGDGTTTSQVTPVAAHGPAALLRARAQFATTALGAGSHLLKATYPGDAKRRGSTSVILHR